MASVTGRVVVLDSLFQDLSLEREIAEQRGWTIERWSGDLGRLSEAEVALHVRTAIDEPMLAALSRCRVIGRFGTGLDTVDLELARRRGIELVNVRDYCVPEMTAHTLGLILALTRSIGGWTSEKSTGGAWQTAVLARRISSSGTVGVVGLGSVGAAVSTAARALGSTVLACSSKDSAAVAALGAEKADLPELLARSDVVTLHLPLLPATRHFIGGPELARLRPGTMLVNTARIGLLEEQAVADALASGQLGGVGLDARLGADSPISRARDTHRVIVTPHVGWFSPRSASVLRREAVSRSIEAFQRLSPEVPA
jgi:D-3-phosphoglycerate dehydrogenase / 2-oxoglutarate reductase